MAWTDERIETLKKMWEAGQTASQIAEELGGVSRNAVIGKAHRLSLQSRPSPVKPNEPDDAPAAAPEPRPAPIIRTPERVAAPAPPPIIAAPVAPAPVAAADEDDEDDTDVVAA